MFWAPTDLVYLSLWLCTTAYTASLVDSDWLHSIPAAVPCGQLTVLELPMCLCLRLKLDYMSTNSPFWPFSVIPTLSHGATTLSHGAKPQPLSMTPPWLHKSKYNVGNFYILPSSSARLRHLWTTASVGWSKVNTFQKISTQWCWSFLEQLIFQPQITSTIFLSKPKIYFSDAGLY